MDSPIVSVVVISYNSSKYILDCLDSIYNQTYLNIELIISDDCSKDDTVDICKEWLSEKKERFVKTVLLTVEKNTGTSANCNRGFESSSGEWIKMIAGDDALFPECVEKFVHFVAIHPCAKFIVGNLKEYKNTFDDENIIEGHMATYNDNNDILDKSADEQFRKMLNGNSFIPPTGFFSVDMIREVGGFDEKYGILEDFPFYLKVLKAGYKCYKMEEYVSKYRTSDTNVFGRMDILFNYRHQYYDYLVRRDLCFPYYSFRERIRTHTRFVTYWIMDRLGLRNNTYFNRLVMKGLRFVFAIFTFDYELIYLYIQTMKR